MVAMMSGVALISGQLVVVGVLVVPVDAGISGAVRRSE